MNRRQFLGALPAIAGLAESAGAQTVSKIRQVDIVHHTHTDVGYTDLPAVVREQQQAYIDQAMDACRRDPHFRWTIESLLELDDWWRASPERHDELLSLVKAGRMDAMALPFNQTPFLNAMEWRQMMAWIPAGLWQSLHIRAAMQNDVNGFPRAGAIALLDRGIRHLLMGLNPDSGGPPFRRPTAFWWKMPDGRRLFVWLGEHYGSAMGHLAPAREGARMRTDEPSVRAARAKLLEHLRAIETEGYPFPRLILTFTHPQHYDNGSPVPSLAPFIDAWNQLQLDPPLRLVTATEAVLAMEKAVGASAPEMEGEWTDWWANGDASGPRELAASRRAKRDLAAAMSPVFGPLPPKEQPRIAAMLKDLCLFDEHTWGASTSIREPYSLRTIGQYVEKSDLAYKPMGLAEQLLTRRTRARIESLPEALYAINPTPAEISGWAAVPGEPKPRRVWIEKLPPNSLQAHREEPPASPQKPQVQLDPSGWPLTASWPGMRRPLFDGALGDFLCVGVVPPADRTTIMRLHASPDPRKREASICETAATYGTSRMEETAHTLVYTQAMLHPRLAQARRTVELWRREPRARVSIRFDRISSVAPEVLFLAFALPDGLPLPRFSGGGVPYTPYRDQLPGSCKDYFAIDGWAHYATPEGHWLWVTRDAPLVAVGAPHVVEMHQQEPADHHRLLAMVFDNCWHTNFVADSHGAMEFQFDLVWKESIEKPADVAEALTADAVMVRNDLR